PAAPTKRWPRDYNMDTGVGRNATAR
ncbi:MAG: hypothetical protein JWN69_884, partial [Alphaproteobacteria bacterium]|nr:hypothetical protein [Alphaproteobacteria bacterium]